MSTFASCAQELLRGFENKEGNLATITRLLTGPLQHLGLAPIESQTESITESLSSRAVSRYIPQIQHAILLHIAPTWEGLLKETGRDGMLRAYFIPSTYHHPCQGVLAVHAYSSITALPFNDFSTNLLPPLFGTFGIDVCFHILQTVNDLHHSKQTVLWEDYIRTVISLPTRLANQRLLDKVDPTFLPENYFASVCRAAHKLLLEQDLTNTQRADWIVFLFEKLVLNGLFPSLANNTLTQTTYFAVNRAPVEPSPSSASWGRFLPLCTWSNQQAIISSLVASIECPRDVYDASEDTFQFVREGVLLMRNVLDDFLIQGSDLASHLDRALRKRNWNVFLGRVFDMWLVNRGRHGLPKMKLRSQLFDQLLEVWTYKEHVEHSPLSQHQSLSAIILLILSGSPEEMDLASKVGSNPKFISSVGHYISHLDKGIRLCGLLVAEVIAEMSGKQLHFGVWEGAADAQVWAKSLRRLIEMTRSSPMASSNSYSETKAPVAIVVQSKLEDLVDSDDSVDGYMSDGSSDAPSLTPGELDAIENDASLRNGSKAKITKPVYITQLLQYIRPSASVGSEAAEKLEIGMKACEDLIRRKKNFGTELSENASELARALLQVQDTYEIEGFDELRERSLTTLVVSEACIVAPVLIEEYFLQMYSTNQRLIILNALAFGARELANGEPDYHPFPSRILEGDKHYAYREETQRNANTLLSVGKNSDAEQGAGNRTIIRSRQLRVNPPNNRAGLPPLRSVHINFSEIGAEYFIAPLISQFWTYLREDRTRELRTHQTTHSYKGSGTGMILHPMMLSHFLRSLAVMVHAAHNSPAFLSVLAPDILELTLALASKNTPLLGSSDPESPAAVLSASLELVLITLTHSQELDRGRSLSLDNTSLLLAIGEWADQVISQLEAGLRYSGGGGKLEATLMRHAVGVASVVTEISTPWKGSMVDVFS